MKRTPVLTLAEIATLFADSQPVRQASRPRSSKPGLLLAVIALITGLLPSSPISVLAGRLPQISQQRTEANTFIQDVLDGHPLEPDKPIERELAGGESSFLSHRAQHG